MRSDARWLDRLAPLLFVGGGLLFGLVLGLLIFYGPPRLPALPAFGSGSEGPAGPTATPAPAPVLGAPAPDFTLAALDGGTVTLSSLRGKVVLINFWATWCGPCEAEMPAIEREYSVLRGPEFEVLAIDLDEPADLVQAFVTRLGLTFPILLDPGAAVNDLYRIRGYPTTFIVDRDGIIVRQHIGYMSDRQLRNYLSSVGLDAP